MQPGNHRKLRDIQRYSEAAGKADTLGFAIDPLVFAEFFCPPEKLLVNLPRCDVASRFSIALNFDVSFPSRG
jgi:hypothetical protein